MYNEYLDFAISIAKFAGKIMKEYFTQDNGASYKFDKTIVTKADKEINDYLIFKVNEKYPDHAISGEEKQYGNSRFKWVCDPVDGTAMYACHIPVCVFSLALVVDGKPELGVIYDPWTDSMYTAIKGQGAFKNGIKISVNNVKFECMKSIAHYDMWPMAEYDIYDVVKQLSKNEYFVSIGSVIRACCCVASGEFNLVVFPGTINKYFDIAAAKVIVEEAGGKVTDLFGNEQRYDQDINGAIVSNGIIHEDVLTVINKYLINKK